MIAKKEDTQMVANKNMGCAQVEDLGEALEQYQASGCTVKRQSAEGCAMVDCRESSLYVCETPRDGSSSLTVAPHDELDEAADAFWVEEA